MADSGVDTSNESSDNPVFDQDHNHSQYVFDFNPPAIPINLNGQPMPIQFFGEAHAHVGKMKCFNPPAIPINLNGQPMPIEFFGEAHEHVGKMKCSTKVRHYRRRKFGAIRYGGMLVSSRNQKLRFAASTNNTELVQKLLVSGADVNSSDEFKRSPLHLAACRGYVDVVKMLLRHGANPNIKDTLGNTPLHLAACTNHIEVVMELLDAGTDVSSNDKNGRNPIQLAQSKLKLIQTRPSGEGHLGGTKWLIHEICMVVNMMLKYMKIQKADAADLESVRERLERVSTQEEVDCEVQNLLDSLGTLKLR